MNTGPQPGHPRPEDLTPLCQHDLRQARLDCGLERVHGQFLKAQKAKKAKKQEESEVRKVWGGGGSVIKTFDANLRHIYAPQRCLRQLFTFFKP